MSYRILHLIRHGQMDPDPSHPHAKQNGWPLTEIGQQQAHLTGQRLQSLPITRVYHSTYPRARETAQLIAQHLATASIVATDTLCECIPYVPESFRQWYTSTRITVSHMQPEAVPADMQPWIDVWSDTTSFADVIQGQARVARVVDTFFQPVADTTQHDIIVSHANLIGALLCYSFGLPPERWVTFIPDLYNCSISEVCIERNGHIRLLSFNDAGHLPFELRTDNDRSMYIT